MRTLKRYGDQKTLIGTLGLVGFCASVLWLIGSPATTSACFAATITVDTGDSGAFSDIQLAIDSAADGDVVLVMPGEYVISEPIDFNRLHDSADPDTPAAKNIVLRSTAGAEKTTIRMSVAQPLEADRASVVLFENGENENSVLEGFTLTGGRGTALPGESRRGGGVYCGWRSSPVVIDCRISRNNNTAPHTVREGGGIFCAELSAPTFVGCTISENVAERGGGVFCTRGSSARFTACTISSNRVECDARSCQGGGVFCDVDSTVTLERCVVAGNEALWGGGIYKRPQTRGDSCHFLTLTNCAVVENRADIAGGGIYLTGHPSNRSCHIPPVDLTHCTIAGNSTSFGGFVSGSLNMTNCVVWGNDGMPSPLARGVTYSLIEGDTSLRGGNINVDPHFMGEGDYRLRSTSPAIDAGLAEGAPAEDIEGNPRPCWGGVDMGAYEYCGASTPGELPFLPPFVRGDVDESGELEITDSIQIFEFLFLDKPRTLRCLDVADANDSGDVDISDGLFILTFLFAGGDAPRAPHPAAGFDLTTDDPFVCGDVVGGSARPVDVHAPASYDPRMPTPLLILLHGVGGTGEGYAAHTAIAPVADAAGILYTVPTGAVRDSFNEFFWDGTDACCDYEDLLEDDVDSTYLREVIDGVKRHYNVDENRVFVMGWSSGGFMAHRVACDHADVVSAIVSVAGAAYLDASVCDPARAVRVLQIHGTADNVIAYGGGCIPPDFAPPGFISPESHCYPSAVASVEQWAAHNGCATIPSDGGQVDLHPDLPGAETTITRYTQGCSAGRGIELWTLAGGGHNFSVAHEVGDLTERIVEWLLSES